MPAKIILPEDLELEILECYKNNPKRKVIELYNISTHTIDNIAKKYNYVKTRKEVYEQTKLSNLELYGVENQWQRVDHIKESYIKKFGVEHPMKLKSVSNKVVANRDSKLAYEHSKQTKLERYSDENYNNPDKNKQTCLDHFGVDHYTKTAEWKENMIESNINKYGTEWYSQTEDWNIKATKTFQEHYGVDRYSQTSEWASRCRKLYFYNDVYFDSLPELSVYIYAVDHEEDIVRCPCVFYYEFNGKIKTYHPDFLYKDELIEVKGDHFFKEDGTMCNPYDHSQDDLYEAKHQCGLNNNVKFWRFKEYAKYLKYFKENYNEQDFIINKDTV